MRERRRATTVNSRAAAPPAVVLMALLLSVPEAKAFECAVSPKTGVSLFWRDRVISWYASSTLSDDMPHDLALEEIKASFASWERVPCSDIELPFRGEVPDRKVSHNELDGNKNIVVFVESGWRDEAKIIAQTKQLYDTQTGLLIDADIELNGQSYHFAKVDGTCFAATNTMDLRGTITHEVGHFLGLDHPPKEPEFREATMYAEQLPCEIKNRTLAADDQDGICFLYPVGMPTGHCAPRHRSMLEDEGGGCTTAGGLHDPWAVFLSATLFVLCRRKGRAGS